MKTFHDLHGGERVSFVIPAGLGLYRGRAVPEYKTVRGVVHRMLCFADHVVVTRYGRPHVVNAGNLKRVHRAKVPS
jgi:hypothetical protein